MGLNNDQATRICFDLETYPIDGAEAFLDEPTAPSNFKDPEKIAAYIAEKKAIELSRCALDPDLCRIVAIGWQMEGEAKRVGHVIADPRDEYDAVLAFWLENNRFHLVGYNCLGFDLPVLMRRSQYLGVPAPSIAIDKYRHPQVTDLQQVLSFNGARPFRSLSFYCRRFGIDVPDPVKGADIGALVAAGQWDDVRSHVLADVEKTARLASKLGLFRMAD